MSSSLLVSRRPRYRLDTVSLSYHLPSSPRPVLSDVTCSALSSELLAIVDPSGTGKTTLLSILAGPIPLTSGRILLNSVPLLSFSRLRRLSAFVTQDDDSLFPLLTVCESISFSARLHCSPTATSPRVAAVLRDLSLDHVADSRMASLSGGERRRVSIGSEVVHNPQVLLLDEPTSGLDSASALHVIALLKSMAAHNGKTVVLTVHQPGFRILDLFDRVLLLSNGSVKHHGSLSSLERRLLDSGHSIPARVNVLEFTMDVVDL